MSYKKRYIFILLLLIPIMLYTAIVANAQPASVGISDYSDFTPHESALLELKSTARGFLMPRMTRAQRISISNPANGLMVIQENEDGGELPGIYYYYLPETRWIRFSISVVSPWNITGNAGTDPTANFLGTTDAEDFVIRTANNERLRILATGRAIFEQGVTVKGSLAIANSGSNTNSFVTDETQAVNITYTLPLTQGAVNTMLQNNGSGNLTWALPGTTTAVSFEGIQTGENTGATMTVGNGSSIILNGTGIIESNIFKAGGATNAVDLDTDETAGILPIAKGGTGGAVTPTDGGIAYGDGSKVEFTSAGTAGQVLVSDGTNAPNWTNPPYWKLGGNTTTNPSTDYVGTTDAQALSIRTNSTEAIKIGTDQNMEFFGNLSLKNLSPTANPFELRLFERNNQGVNYSGFRSDTLAKSLIYTMPKDTVGELAVLVNKGSNQLQWMKTGDLQTQTRSNILQVINLAVYSIPDTVTHILIERNGVSRVNLFSGPEYAGKVVFIKRLSNMSNNHFVDICPVSGEKIDRLGTSNLDRGYRLKNANDAIMAVYDGNNWWIMTAYLSNASVVTCDCP